MHLRLCALAGLAVLVAVIGCGPATPRIPTGSGVPVEPVIWPPPPLPPRIRLTRVVARPADLGIRKGFWRRVGELLTGREEEQLVRPTGVAARGPVVYVADPGTPALWILDPDAGRFRRIQAAGETRLVSPVAVALARSDRIFLADSYLAKVFVFDAEARLAQVIDDARLRRPAGLAYDAARDRLYVVDSAAHGVWVFDGRGTALGEIGRRGAGPGEFNFPTHVAVDRDGTLYVTDGLGFRVQFFSPEGEFRGQFGRHGDSSGEFARPKGVAVDSEGHVYVVEALFDAVQIFDREGRFLLSFGERGLRPGQFWLPGGLFIDDQDRIYVADAYNQRVQIFQYVSRGDDA